MGKQKYESDIVLRETYRDTNTGIEGKAIAVAFFEFACERVTLELVVNGEIKEYSFDAPRLVHVPSGAGVTTERSGGPRSMPPRTGVTP